MLISPPSTSPPELASPTSTNPPETLRDCYLQAAKRSYPNIVPRNDFDILALGSGQFKGADKDFYAYSDRAIELTYIRFTQEEIDDGSAKAQVLMEVTENLNKVEVPTGTKPSPGEDDVHIRPLPRSEYSLRLWGRGLAAKREYCLDFVRTATGQPVNSPFEYELWVVPNRKTPWLPAATSRLYSVERSFGIAQKDILPGEEKFVLLEGTACILKRPGMRSIYFEVPVRPRDIELGDVDEITFDQAST